MSRQTLCAVVMGSTTDELIRQIHDAKKMANSVEVRVDYIVDQKNSTLPQLKKETGTNMIITCRRKDEGGKWNGNEKKRLHVLRQAYDLGFSSVDIELRTLEEGQFRIPHNTETKTIISFHDFAKTPSLDKLMTISKRMQEYEPDIKKIATMVKNEKDIQTLYKMLIEKKEGERYCIVGMGDIGKQTRIVSPLLGGVMTYCSINTEGSAPGQMICSAMSEIYRLLH